MTLFAVTLRGRSERLVIEAATAIAEHGWWAFRNAEGSLLATLPAADVQRMETLRRGSKNLGGGLWAEEDSPG